MNDEKFNHNLREALRLMAEESAPAAGWEQRVLDESLGKPRRRIWVRLSVAVMSAAAAALILFTPVRPEPIVIAPATAEPQLLIAQAPDPAEHVEPAKPGPRKAAAPRQPVVIILPEPLAAEGHEQEKMPEELSVPEYIDALLARNLAEEQEMISSILNPEFNASYIPLQ